MSQMSEWPYSVTCRYGRRRHRAEFRSEEGALAAYGECIERLTDAGATVKTVGYRSTHLWLANRICEVDWYAPPEFVEISAFLPLYMIAVDGDD